MTIRPLLAAALLATTTMLASPSLAQTTPPSSPAAGAAAGPAATKQSPAPEGRRAEMRARLAAADANKDGQWSREEWTAAGRQTRGFDMMDTDQNNQLTREELRAGMEKMQAMRGGGGGGGGFGGGEPQQGAKPE